MPCPGVRRGAVSGRMLAIGGLIAFLCLLCCGGALVLGTAWIVRRAAPAPAPAELVGEAIQPAFRDLVMVTDIAASGLTELAEPTKWDQKLVERVARAQVAHASSWTFWESLDARRDEYAFVLVELRKAGLPDVFAAIPYQESRYRSDATAYTCAAGAWQLMPEVALRVGVGVSDCELRGGDQRWSPVALVPPGLAERVYNDPGPPPSCRIQSCTADERRDLRAATAGAIKLLAEAFNDPMLRDSGAVTSLTIASYNAGYDDARFRDGKVRSHNILPAYRAWLVAKGLERAPDFIGQNLTCTGESDPGDACGGSLFSETQQYVPTVIAQHLLAVCYYGQYDGEEPAFAAYPSSLGSWCSHVKVPTPEAIAARRPSPPVVP